MRVQQPKKRSRVARELHTPKYQQRIVRDKKKYSRKQKFKDRDSSRSFAYKKKPLG